jgi:HEAT repeat protein
MRSLDALLALAAAIALGGFGPMAYVLLRQWRARRAQATALQRMKSARALVSGQPISDLSATANALAGFDLETIDRTVEQLAADVVTPEQRNWIGQLARQLGALDRYCERAAAGHTWNERAHAVRVLGSLGVAAAVPTLAGILRDRNEDETVRSLAADALAAISDPAVV